MSYVAERLAEITQGKPVTRRAPPNLYFIQCGGDDGPIKIGVAGDVRGRMLDMQIGCPFELELLKSVPGAARFEKKIHKVFEADKVSGEWFHPSERLIDFIDVVDDRSLGLGDDRSKDEDRPLTDDEALAVTLWYAERDWRKLRAEREKSAPHPVL